MGFAEYKPPKEDSLREKLRDAPKRVPAISTSMSLGRASVLLAAMIALSRIAGYGRLVLTSYLYGIGPHTDAYNAAFNIPDTISILIAGGALATGFVPVFTDLLARGDTAGAQRTFRAMWTLLFSAFGVITLVLFIGTFSPANKMLAPQGVGPEVLELYLHTLRILLVAQFIFVMGGLFAGTLNALRLFWFPAMQPVMFNLGIIFFGLAGPFFLHMGIESQAWGALGGAIIGSLLIQIPALTKQGLSLRPLWDWEDAGVQRVLKTLLPIAFGLSSGQIIALSLPRFFAAYLPIGDLTALDNANRLMQVPIAILAAGPAIALYPTISLLWSENRDGELRAELSRALRRTLLFMLLGAALIMALRHSLIHLLLEHGAFGAQQTQLTSDVLMFYAFCLLGLGAQQFLARGFYATGNTKAPVTIGVLTMLIFFVLAFIGVWLAPDGVPGAGAKNLAIAAAISITFLAGLMWFVLSMKLGGLENRRTFTVGVRGLLAAAVAFGVAALAENAMFSVVANFDTETTSSLIKLVARLMIVGVSATAGIVFFLIIAAMLQVREVRPLTKKLTPWNSGGRYFAPVDTDS